MESPEWYSHLTTEQATAELDRISEQYWDAIDLLGSLAASRAALMNIIKEAGSYERA